jgi:hypothetical protein
LSPPEYLWDVNSPKWCVAATAACQREDNSGTVNCAFDEHQVGLDASSRNRLPSCAELL